MRIIIAGAGEVGFHLAKLLAREQHDIILIDLDQDKLEYAAKHLDVITLKGSSTSYNTLQEADVTQADLLIAVTSIEETNVLTAAIGKKLGARKTIARIRNTEFLFAKDTLDLKVLGVDHLISPESLAADEIKRLIKQSTMSEAFEFAGGKLNLIGIYLNESAPIVNRTLNETANLNPKSNFITITIHRENETIIPRGDTRFEVNDHVFFVALPDGVEHVLNLTGQKPKEIRNIMILGGSKIGVRAAKRLSKNYNLKMIEIAKNKCYDLADELPGTLVVHGDGRNVGLLEEEGIENMDAFIAVSGSTDTNILTSLIAKKKGVPRAISLVENIDYINLSQGIGVDTMINKKLIAANSIFRFIRKGEVMSLVSLTGTDAEVMELKAKADSKIVKRPIRDLNLPKSTLIGGIIREDHSYIPMGDFHILPDDHVVIIALPEAIKAVERFF